MVAAARTFHREGAAATPTTLLHLYCLTVFGVSLFDLGIVVFEKVPGLVLLVKVKV